MATSTGGSDPLADALDLAMPLLLMYLGPVSKTSGIEEQPERIALLALHKLIVEAGTLPPPSAAYEPHDGAFEVDPKGNAAALDLRHALAALRSFAAWAAAGAPPAAAVPAEQRGAASRVASLSAAAPMTATLAAAPMSARALRTSARTRAAAPSKPGCGCPDTGQPPEPEACTPWTLSCAARNRVRDCLKDAACDLMRCVEDFLCANTGATSAQRRAVFRQCITEVLCRALKCLREVLCPPPRPPALPPAHPNELLPCSYAVEDLR